MHWLRWLRRSRPPLGLRGEKLAARFLKRRGFAIVAVRERGGLGEIDLVAVDGRTVVFVEVKTRRSHRAGHPAEAVDRRKRRRLTRLALAYLKRYDLLAYHWRFDIIAITWPCDGHPLVEHFPAAFEPVGVEQSMY